MLTCPVENGGISQSLQTVRFEPLRCSPTLPRYNSRLLHN